MCTQRNKTKKQMSNKNQPLDSNDRNKTEGRWKGPINNSEEILALCEKW